MTVTVAGWGARRVAAVAAVTQQCTLEVGSAGEEYRRANEGEIQGQGREGDAARRLGSSASSTQDRIFMTPDPSNKISPLHALPHPVASLQQLSTA